MDRGKQVVMAAQEEGEHGHKNFPPGYRFVPNDMELLYYLKLKILNKPVRINSIIDVELYKYHPHDLCQSSRMYGKKEWYFFTSRAKKYSNDCGRPNRRAADGYWKATGREVIVQSNGQEVGCKRVLVYFEGKSNEGLKTNWIMHEFTIHGMKDIVARSSINPNPNDNMRLDTCLCRIYYRTSKSSKNEEQDSQENLQGEYFADPRSKIAGQSNSTDQYPLVEPSNPPLITYMHGDHMILQSNIQYSSLPTPQPLIYIPSQYNPLLTPGTNIHGNCMAMESNDQYQPITCMNGDDDYMDFKDPCFSSLSDLLPATDLCLPGLGGSSDVQLQSLPIHMHGDVGCSTSNFAASTSTSNDDDWFDQLDRLLPPFDPSMLDLPLGDSSNRLFQPGNVLNTGSLKGDGDVPESTILDKM